MRTGDQIVQNLPWRWNVQGKIFLILMVAVGMMIKFGPETKGMELDAVVEDGDAAPVPSPTPVLD